MMKRQSSGENSRALPALFWAGLVSGSMDITAAFVTWGIKGVSPARILRGIAAGLLGAKALKGGWETAALGLACHFFIAYSAATVFYLASRKIRFMTQREVVAGVMYGMIVYAVMYWVVKPVSLVSPRPFSWTEHVVAIITHMVCVGLPISLMVREVGGET